MSSLKKISQKEILSKQSQINFCQDLSKRNSVQYNLPKKCQKQRKKKLSKFDKKISVKKLSFKNFCKKLSQKCLPEKFYFKNGSREFLLKSQQNSVPKNELSTKFLKNIYKKIRLKNFIKKIQSKRNSVKKLNKILLRFIKKKLSKENVKISAKKS